MLSDSAYAWGGPAEGPGDEYELDDLLQRLQEEVAVVAGRAAAASGAAVHPGAPARYPGY